MYNKYIGFQKFQFVIFSETYKIANSRGLMGIFSLMKTSAKIGEDIVGMFSFTEGSIPCVQVSQVVFFFFIHKNLSLQFVP